MRKDRPALRSRCLRVVGCWLAFAVLGLACASARAQAPVVGWLWLDSPSNSAAPSIVQQLKPLGQVEGRTFVLESRYALGDNARYPALARELLDRRPAVIATVCGEAIRAIRALDPAVPVIAACADPKNFLGEVASLRRPGGRTTGFTFLAPESAAKRLQLLKELLPGLSRVGVLYDRTGDWGSYWQAMEPAAARLGLTLTKLAIARAEDVDEAFANAARQRTGALVVFPDPVCTASHNRIMEYAAAKRLPTVFELPGFVTRGGGLLSYGPDWEEFAPRVYASYVDKVLRGASPGELPIQQPTRFKLAINLGTARALGLKVPPSFLALADLVVD